MHYGGPTSWHKGLFYAPIKKPIKKEQTSKSYKIQYFCVFNTSHTVLGDMLNFCQKLVCITRHAISFYRRPAGIQQDTPILY